jgi:hypothetical protein
MRASMQKVPQRSTSAFANIEESACAAVLSLIHRSDDQCMRAFTATQ